MRRNQGHSGRCVLPEVNKPEDREEKKRQAEKSIERPNGTRPKLTPPDEDARYEIVRWYDKDKGVPGWKRGASTPRLLQAGRRVEGNQGQGHPR